MLVDERRHRIAMTVLAQGGATVAQLSDEFGVSPVTIRSDLEALEQQRILKRNHGGAVAAQVARFAPAFQEQSSVNLEAKMAIAQVAARLPEDGDKGLLDAGSTTLLLARQLRSRDRAVTVVTNSVYLLNELVNSPQVELIVVGGMLYEPGLCFVGAPAEWFLDRMTADISFLGVNGISLRGVSVNNMPEAGVKRCVARAGGRTVVLADSSKLGLDSFVNVTSLADVDTVITDDRADHDVVAELREAGVEVLFA